MDRSDADLDRVLRAAAKSAMAPAEAPFGFDTRVVAQWRSRGRVVADQSWEVARIFRRIGAGAVIVALGASGGAFWQFKKTDREEPLATGYMIADTAIEAGALR